MGLEFNDYVGGIEDGIIGALTAALMKNPDTNPDGYLKEIGTYGGEIDEKTLRANLDELQARTPLALVAYTEGEDKLAPATAPVLGQPRRFRHDCSFAVIALSEDARGGAAQRKGAPGGSVGAYRMIADFRRLLGGLWLIRREVEDADDVIVARAGDRKLAEGEQLLTFEPLKISRVDYIGRLPDITAYAAIFDTYFVWTEPDRRGAGIDVEEIVFSVSATGSAKDPGTLPGVQVET